MIMLQFTGISSDPKQDQHNVDVYTMSFVRPLLTVFGEAAASRPIARASGAALFAGAGAGLPSSPLAATARRSKHSATQVKRLFKQNPQRLRLLKKKGAWPAPATPIPDRAYAPVFKPTFLSNGWSAPPPPDLAVPEYPFRVSRTGRKPFGAVGFLPVYRDVR